MPHLVILYSGNLEGVSDIDALCRTLADTLLGVRDEEDKAVFPTGGTRVLAYPAPHFAIADGGTAGRAAGVGADYAFVYLNLRMARGRSDAVKKNVGDLLLACASRHFAALLESRPLGVTVQVDESPGQVYDGKCSSLHSLFR